MRTTVRALLDWIERFNLIAGSVGGACVILFILTIVPDALTRSFASYSMQGISEFNILTLVVLVFLGLASAQCRKENFRVKILVDFLPARARAVFDVLAFATQALVAGLFAYLTTARAITSWQVNEQTFSVIAFPVWPARIVIAIGFWMLLVQLLIDILRVVAPSWAPEQKAGTDEVVGASEL